MPASRAPGLGLLLCPWEPRKERDLEGERRARKRVSHAASCSRRGDERPQGTEWTLHTGAGLQPLCWHPTWEGCPQVEGTPSKRGWWMDHWCRELGGETRWSHSGTCHWVPAASWGVSAVPQSAHSWARQAAWVPWSTCLVLLASQGRPEGGIQRPRLSKETFVVYQSPPSLPCPASQRIWNQRVELVWWSKQVPEAAGLAGTEGEDKFRIRYEPRLINGMGPRSSNWNVLGPARGGNGFTVRQGRRIDRAWMKTVGKKSFACFPLGWNSNSSIRRLQNKCKTERLVL